MANEMIKGARILLECLSRLGIKEIFGYPGGAVIPIYDELYSFKDIKHYSQDMNKELFMKQMDMQDLQVKSEYVLQLQDQEQQT